MSSRISKNTGAICPSLSSFVRVFSRGDICFDLSAYIGQLQVPTVFVWGAQSRFSSPEHGQRLARLNPNVIKSFHLIPDAGVLPHLELPAIVTGLLAKYVVP